MPDRLLLQHLDYTRKALSKYSEIAKLAEHSDNIGDAREVMASSFLDQNLPQFIRYHSGEIFDSEENRSGQIDIVVHPISAPKLHLFGTINLFPAETVLAAIEVKSMLNKKGIYDALDSCYDVKKLNLRRKGGTETVFDFDHIPFIVFGFVSNTMDTVIDNIAGWIEEKNKKIEGKVHFGLLPDLIVVLETLTVAKDSFSLLRSSEYWSAGLEFPQLYRQGKEHNPLFNLFEYLLTVVQFWSNNPRQTQMPIRDYVKDLSSIHSLFEFKVRQE